MKEKTIDKEGAGKKVRLDLTPQFNKAWNKVLREINSRGIEIIEFMPKLMINYHWAIHIEKDKAENTDKVNIRSFNKTLNKTLKRGFNNIKENESKFWNRHISPIEITGFYIPKKDIYGLNPDKLKSHILFYSLLSKHFEYNAFFFELNKNRSLFETNTSAATYPIWLYIKYYGKFLYVLKNIQPKEYETYAHWYTNFLDQNNFHCRLPSEQLVIILLQRCESIVFSENRKESPLANYPKAYPSIESFFEKFEFSITQYYKSISSISEVDSQVSELKLDIIKAIDKIFNLDLDAFLIQDVLDNRSDQRLLSYLPIGLQIKYGSLGLSQVTGILREMIMNPEESSTGQFKENDLSVPKFRRPVNKLYPSEGQYWYNLSNKERQKINERFKNNISSALLKHTNYVKSNAELHWINLINLISAPILYWKTEKDFLLPQWNLFEDIHASTLRSLHRKKKKSIEEENKMLDKHLRELFQIDTIEELETYKQTYNTAFTEVSFHEKWLQELERREALIRQREKYYDTRMKEFGIDQSVLNDKIKRVWLKEMLLIEDQIKPYINYVKKAFQSALPIRKSVVFSDYRHISDGVEFDPDTLFDHEKWIRANVMKAMQSKLDIGEAIQINTFCLDFSGSMKHSRMRNLFKMLYLLVIGLEDRKSYDAFHFFSDQFIEAVDFSNEFTNRKVLFKILKQISRVYSNSINYSGVGGTNISEGIGMSHKKMKEFIAEFKQNNPQANIVSSIFVITDGEPSLGIINIPKLREFIEEKRKDGDVEIKGIFIKSVDDVDIDLMKDIFGEEHFIETDDFKEGVNRFVKIMTETYKQQRKDYKWKKKKQKLGLSK